VVSWESSCPSLDPDPLSACVLVPLCPPYNNAYNSPPQVSAQDKTIIATAMAGSYAPGSLSWDHLECDILHQKPPGGKCAANVEPGTTPSSAWGMRRPSEQGGNPLI
jgi:hypothetical protein